jgi:Fe-S-cluster containining protein
MSKMNLRAFLKKAAKNKRSFRRFLTKMEKQPSRYLTAYSVIAEPEVWKEVDCLHCANCCKSMTPTFNHTDIKRISAHLGQTPDEFKTKYLLKEKGTGDWINIKQPCQFLNLKNNKCSIYEVRPADCAGFPHLQKKMLDFGHVHKQNIEFCPATYRMVEKMKEAVANGTVRIVL